MSRHPGAEFIPAAFLLPAWFIAPRVALIEQACNAWEEDDNTYLCTAAPLKRRVTTQSKKETPPREH